MQHSNATRFLIAAAVAASCFTAAHAGVVVANSPSGDAYTSPSAAGTGQAIGASGWYYNNVRNNAVVGIDSSHPLDGNASVHFNGPAGSKADVEYLSGGVNVAGDYYATTSLGRFADFNGMSYSWYRDSSSQATSNLHPALRVLLDLDGNLATTNDRGGLVFERSYNPSPSAVPTDAWTTDAVGAGTYLWNFGLAPLGTLYDLNHNGYAYDSTLGDWKASTELANAVIIGFSTGIGSGWGEFSGAVDDVGWTIAGRTTTSNFELTAAAASLAGLSLTRRKSRAGRGDRSGAV